MNRVLRRIFVGDLTIGYNPLSAVGPLGGSLFMDFYRLTTDTGLFEARHVALVLIEPDFF